MGKEGNGSRPAVPRRGKERTEKVKQEKQKQGKTKGLNGTCSYCRVPPLLLRGGARRRPLTQSGGGGCDVCVLALHHICGNQHRVMLQNCVHGGPKHQIGETCTHW